MNNKKILPSWLGGKSINEVAFCTEFVQNRTLKCVNGQFYGIGGVVSDDEIPTLSAKYLWSISQRAYPER